MEIQATAGIFPASSPSLLRRIGRLFAATVIPIVIISLALSGWVVRRDGVYTSSSDTGYWLGVIGGSLMVVLLIYPLRKRFRVLAFLGPLKHWFRFHLVAGIAGPVIVLFHSTFRVGSVNAAVALGSMLLVVASGIVGRVIYRKIHHGLYGSRATAADLRNELEQQMVALEPVLSRLPLIKHEIQRFSALVAAQPEGRWRNAKHFISIELKRYLVGRRVRRAIAGYDMRLGSSPDAKERLQILAGTIDDTLRAVQRTAQFSTYERLFSLWHVVHIPFLCMLLATAIVHVVAVHAY